MINMTKEQNNILKHSYLTYPLAKILLKLISLPKHYTQNIRDKNEIDILKQLGLINITQQPTKIVLKSLGKELFSNYTKRQKDNLKSIFRSKNRTKHIDDIIIAVFGISMIVTIILVMLFKVSFSSKLLGVNLILLLVALITTLICTTYNSALDNKLYHSYPISIKNIIKVYRDKLPKHKYQIKAHKVITLCKINKFFNEHNDPIEIRK